MRKLLAVLFLLLCNVGLFGQVSPIFPSRAVTDADMWVSSDTCVMRLAYPIGPTDTTIQVTTAVGCPTANFLIKIENEVIGISSVSGVTLSVATGGRHYGGTTAAGHARGQIANMGYFSYQQNRDSAEIESLEAFLMTGTGTAAWGHILGTLTDQGDLVTALGGKQDTLAAYSTISGLYGYPSTFPPITTGLALLASANTFTAGAKQTMSQSATTAGLNLGALTSDPSGLSEGDFWYNAGVLKIRQGAATKSVAYLDSNITGSAATFTDSLVGDASGAMGTTKVQFYGVAILPPATAADVGRVYRITQATTANVCIDRDTGGSAKAACVTLDGTSWTALGGSGGAATDFSSLVTPSTSMTLTCPQNSSGLFLGNAALSGNVTVTAVSGCPGSTSVSSQLSFAFQQPTPIGGGPYTVTLPSPFNQCDFSMVTAGVTLTETGTYNGTDYFGVTCSPSGGPSLDAGPVPTITGCGTVGSQIGNSLVGTFTSGQTTCTPVLTGLPTAPHGYNCTITERATGAQYGNVSSTATAPTYPAITTTSGDVMAFSCRAY
jgi:hypothetical protein